MNDTFDDQESAGPPTGTEDLPSLEALRSELDAVRTEKDALLDRLLRTAAEFDNFRKRIDRERRSQADNAEFDLLLEILPIIDDLERALGAPEAGDAEAYRTGVELIHRQML